MLTDTNFKIRGITRKQSAKILLIESIIYKNIKVIQELSGLFQSLDKSMNKSTFT